MGQDKRIVDRAVLRRDGRGVEVVRAVGWDPIGDVESWERDVLFDDQPTPDGPVGPQPDGQLLLTYDRYVSPDGGLVSMSMMRVLSPPAAAEPEGDI